MGGGRSAREAWRCRARSIRGSGRELNCSEVPGAPSADEEVTRGPALLRGAAPLEASSSATARSVCGGGGWPEARSARQRSSRTASSISKGTSNAAPSPQPDLKSRRGVRFDEKACVTTRRTNTLEAFTHCSHSPSFCATGPRATGRRSVQPVASPPLSPPSAHARHHPRPPSPAGPARSAP